MIKKQLFHIILLALTFFSFCVAAQTSSYIVTATKDTIDVDKFDIQTKKVKIKINDDKKVYDYEALTALYDAKRQKHYEKISPVYVEYKGPSGKTFFAERLTKGKVQIYKCLMNQLYIPVTNSIGGVAGGSNSFFVYYIGLEGLAPEMLCYYEIEMSKEEYKLYKLYLHSSDTIQKEIEALFFSEEDKKEDAVINLVERYNQWWKKYKLE
ncbi:hypothetical protein [Flavobacterium lacus]|uniref:GLPGLI family protein n=1 Tax=Flavobacterium lacus TaxID=1353778 RepID=A0A328WJJ9_9FLAO|nr:hypothetical protein [Flavobacterium lacus]RAR46360.1 hypothetical protein B0I10_1216 [Flavobacterium lacus]